ncbi:hypothetical protein CSUB01_03616 [Colletotrichum sublineola]|uniref:Uncharacterized protein n=1 Tax=Colletotrichum sublineola TaxID=1173701 RepID=A0A066XF43_COLSU|nr:hypothetical protein CSUB01_03616 [Colletotrichum sublineola]
MFFSCRPRPAPRPPRPPCMYAGCSHRALRCDSKSEGKAILSLYCKDRQHPARNPPLILSGGIGLANDGLQTRKTAAAKTMAARTNASAATPARTGHTVRNTFLQTPASPRGATRSAPLAPRCALTTPPYASSPAAATLAPTTASTAPPTPAPTATARASSTAGTGARTTGSAGRQAAAIRGPSRRAAGSRTSAGIVSFLSPCLFLGDRVGVETLTRVCFFLPDLPAACIAPGCPGTVKGGMRFCPQHECIYPPCREQKDNAADPSRLYCASHTCSSHACPQPAADLAGPPAARYCVTHKCAGPGCGHPAKPAGRHCALHACLRESCPSPRAADPLTVPGSQFCAAHECRTVGCRAAARPDGSYCEGAHACAVPGCPAPRGGGGGGDVEKAITPTAMWMASVCCASHTAKIARDNAAAWGFHTGSGEGRGGVPAPQRFSYHSQTEEALGQRLKEERERLEREARLDHETRAWHPAEGRDVVRGGEAAVVGLGARGRGLRRGRSGSGDSGFGGSPDVSDSTSSNTFVS